MREDDVVNIAYGNDEFVFPNAQVLNKSAGVRHGKKFITVTLIGGKINTDSLRIAMMKRLDENRWLRGTELTIQQGVAFDNDNKLDSKAITTSMFNEIYADNQKRIAYLSTQIDSLNSVLARESEFERLSPQLAPEIKILFPKVKDIALSRNVFCDVNTGRTDTVNLAIVKINGTLNNSEQKKFIEYIEVRSGVKLIKLKIE